MESVEEHAVIITGREQAEYSCVQRDAQPLGPREVSGRTLASIISPGTELAHNYQGNSFPNRPGYAAVFEIDAVGSEVIDIELGDRVFCIGPHQSYQRRPREQVVRLPPGLSPEVAVLARLMAISMSTLTTTSARPPEKVLVTGLGIVGNLAAQIFAACGYELIACGHRASRRAIAAQSGIGRVFPTVPLDDPTIAGHVGLVAECSGNEQASLDGCRVVRKGGEVVLVGVPWRRQTDLCAHDLLHAVFHKYVVLRSGWEWELPLQRTDFRVNSTFGNLAAALKWLAEGRIRLKDLLTKVSPREAQQAYQDLLHKRCPQLTVVFDWSS